MTRSNQGGDCTVELERRLLGRRGRYCALVCGAVVAIVLCAGLLGGRAQSASSSAGPAGAPAQLSAPLQKSTAGSPAEDAQKQEIARQCADLLKLATELKTEVDKTTRNELSVTVVRKASQIEKLARKVRTGRPNS